MIRRLVRSLCESDDVKKLIAKLKAKQTETTGPKDRLPKK
jgi:hypothetical protein